MKLSIKKPEDVTAAIKKYTEDLAFAENDLQNSSDFYRRSFVRALFSMIEGTIFILKQTCLTDLFSSGKLSPNDLAMLREINYDIDNKGDTYEQIKFIKLDTNFKYCVKTLDKIFQTGYKIDTGNNDWRNFLNAIAVRNRITHPKVIDDLNITDREIQYIQKTSQWFNYFIIHCVTKVFEKLGLTRVQNGANK